jgi:hypothetical protein
MFNFVFKPTMSSSKLLNILNFITKWKELLLVASYSDQRERNPDNNCKVLSKVIH